MFRHDLGSASSIYGDCVGTVCSTLGTMIKVTYNILEWVHFNRGFPKKQDIVTVNYVNFIEVAIGSYVASNKRLLAATYFHVKHRTREPEGVHGQIEGCNRNLRPKAAVAKELHGKML